MSSSKIKNIIIIVLLLLNMALFFVWAIDVIEAGRTRKAEEESIVELFESKGIIISDDVDLDLEAPSPCTIIRSAERDDKLIDGFIDFKYREDLGGNVVFYSSSTGQASLRGTGEIVLIFDDDMPEISGDTAKSLSRYMERKGIELSSDNAERADETEGYTLVVPCAYKGRAIYNSKLSFTLTGDRLIMVDGIRVFDGETKIKEETVFDSISALMHFLDYTRSEGYICSEIWGLEAGYFMNVAVSGESSLRPVWKISTNTGDVFINAVSGKAENAGA